jgi:predicted alpha/beta superfamily hydrolase
VTELIVGRMGEKTGVLIASTPLLAAMLPTTDYYEIESSAAGARFAVWVSRPVGYEPGVRYPAVYLPDGNITVQVLAGRSTRLSHDPIHPIKPLLLVSVGYIGPEAQDLARVRNRDLVPPGEPIDPRLEHEVDRLVGVGGFTPKAAADYKASLKETHADRFLTFLLEELHPSLAKRYEIDDSQCGLFGYSFGGLFAVWTALKRPPLLSRIGAGSPGILLRESTVLTELERQQREQTSHAGRHLHVNMQDLEITTPSFYQSAGEGFARFCAKLGHTPLPGLDFSARILTGETHSTGWAPSWFSYLRACYST